MKRKNLFIGLSSLSVACLAGAFAFLSVAPAKADTTETQEPMQVENVAMANGAQVRLSSDSTQGNYAGMGGLRFVMYIDKDTYDTAVSTYGKENVEVGMYYVGKNVKVGDTIDETTDEEMQDIATIPASAKHAVMQAYTETKAGVTVDSSYTFCVAQLEIPETAYNTQLIANGYIKTTVGETVTYTWAANPVTRSIAQVASIAITKGETHDDLDKYINAVATEDAFAFANTEIETDMYKQAELTVGATLPAHLKVVWNSDNESVATVDETGNITKVGKGTANITAKIGNNVRTAKVTIGDPVALNINGEEDADMLAASNGVKYKYVDVNSEELNGFTGGYSGAALKHDAGGSGLHNLYSAYTKEELQEIAKDYNKVTFWFAIGGGVDNPDSKGFIRHYVNENTVTTLALGLTENQDYYIADGGKWAKWTLSLNDYISILMEEVKDGVPTGKSYVSLYQAWAYNFATNPNMYLGNVEFTFEEIVVDPYIVKVNESATDKITYGTTKSTYVVAGSEDIADFTGDYTGNAVYLAGYYGNSFLGKNTFTAEEIEVIKTKYTTVSMWVAVDGVEGGWIRLYKNATATPASFLNKVYANHGEATSFNKDLNKTWKKYSLSIEDFLSICVDGTFYLCNPWTSGLTAGEDLNGDGNIDTKDIRIYFGDIYFE